MKPDLLSPFSAIGWKFLWRVPWWRAYEGAEWMESYLPSLHQQRAAALVAARGSASKHVKATAVVHLICFTGGETEALGGTGNCPGSLQQGLWQSWD